ncbi:hypothetical protein BJF90_24290 [Pseudonocardia sp. CNS-004]|nr:hypothetical protein BJF90_24290 [Pseudonocardia sp. CNS-004]
MSSIPRSVRHSGSHAHASTLTRWPNRSISVEMASPVSESTTVMRSGTLTATAPSSMTTRFSFWISTRTRRPRSSPMPSIVTEPRVKPPSAIRSMSITLPPTTTRAPSSSATSATGSFEASSRRPTSIARLTVRSMTAPFGPIRWCAPRHTPPAATVKARACRSSQAKSSVRSTVTLPITSLSTANSRDRPTTLSDTIVAFGNARPIPSASSTASPSAAAQPAGRTPLLPPISAAMITVTGRSISRSTSRSRVAACALAPSISMPTDGAPIPDMTITASSGPSSSTPTSRTGPCRSIAASAVSCGVCTAPPPPVPKMAAPAASDATSSRRIRRPGVVLMERD